MKPSFTELRREILKLIEDAEQPLMVKEIHERISSEAAAPKPNLSTIYRALDFLLKKGLIKSISFSVDGKFFYGANREHAHFLFCKSCTQIREFDQCFAGHIQQGIEKEFNYKITDHFFYFAGICNACREAKVREFLNNP